MRGPDIGWRRQFWNDPDHNLEDMHLRTSQTGSKLYGMLDRKEYKYYIVLSHVPINRRLDQSTTRPIEVRRRLFDPVDERLPLDRRTLVRRLHLDLLPVDKLPLLFLHDHQALLQLLTAQQNIKRHLVPFCRRKLRRQLRFPLCQEIRLKHKKKRVNVSHPFIRSPTRPSKTDTKISHPLTLIPPSLSS